MLGRLDELLARHRTDVESRIAELVALRDEIDAYRDRVGRRTRSATRANGGRRRRTA